MISFPAFLSHTPTHAHKGQRSLLWLSQSHSYSFCLPVWVEFNRVLWCERDVSLKNIRHQRSLLRWSGISSCAHSAHSLDLVSFLIPQGNSKVSGSQRIWKCDLANCNHLKFLTRHAKWSHWRWVCRGYTFVGKLIKGICAPNYTPLKMSVLSRVNDSPVSRRADLTEQNE